MWLAIILTISMSPNATPTVDFKVGHGRYDKVPHVHLRIDTSALPGSLFPVGAIDRTQVVLPMLSFLKLG